MKRFYLLAVLFLLVTSVLAQPTPEFLLPQYANTQTGSVPFSVYLKMPNLMSWQMVADGYELISRGSGIPIMPKLLNIANMASIIKLEDVIICYGFVGDDTWSNGEHTLRFSAIDSIGHLASKMITINFEKVSEPLVVFKDFMVIHDTLQVDTVLVFKDFMIIRDTLPVNPVLLRHITKDTIALKQGWNMIGGLSYPVPINMIMTNVSVSNFYSFEDIYKEATMLKPNTGYWVRADKAGLLIVTSDWY
jgi:hypothetical protein